MWGVKESFDAGPYDSVANLRQAELLTIILARSEAHVVKQMLSSLDRENSKTLYKFNR